MATRMGHTEILYVGEVLGIILIILGYHWNVRGKPAVTTSAPKLATLDTGS